MARDVVVDGIPIHLADANSDEDVAEALAAREAAQPRRGIRVGSAAAEAIPKGSATVPFGPGAMRVAREWAPSAAAAVVPGLGELAGITRFGSPLVRMLASGMSGFGTDLAMQPLAGEHPDIGVAAKRGGVEMLAHGGGELVRWLEKFLGETLMRSAVSHGVTPQLQDEYAAALGRRHGRSVEPHEADFAKQAIGERVPVGQKFAPVGRGKTGSTAVGEKIAKEARKVDAALILAGPMPMKVSQALASMRSLRGELLAEAKGTGSREALASLDEILAGIRHENPGSMTPESFDALKSQWQALSRRIKQGKVEVTPRTPVEQRVYDEASKESRAVLERHPWTARVVEPNQRMSELFPLQDVVTNAEKAAMRGSKLPEGTTAVAKGLFLPPRVTSRAALFLTHPVIREATTAVPHAISPQLMDLLDELHRNH